MLEGPFAHAHGSIGYPKTAQTGNCFMNGRAPQWALDVLKSRAHGTDSGANGGDLTLTDPVWRNATCDERNMPKMTSSGYGSTDTSSILVGNGGVRAIRAVPEKAESGGDSQAARVMIHPAGWEEASLDGKTLFAGFVGTHDVGCSFRTVSTRGGADVRCQRELCDQAHAAG